MQKIPTLFVRDEEDRRYVTSEVTPGCEWVLAGEGRATRKYDGTCVMLDENGRWWARREVKPDKQGPDHFVPVNFDETTGKTVGWEPIEQSAFAKYHTEAVLEAVETVEESGTWKPGTYELVGPKVNGNPEGYEFHWLLRHADAEHLSVPDLSFDGIRKAVLALGVVDGCEGIVWHHEDGRMVKIKARDFAR